VLKYAQVSQTGTLFDQQAMKGGGFYDKLIFIGCHTNRFISSFMSAYGHPDSGAFFMRINAMLQDHFGYRFGGLCQFFANSNRLKE
ncbi:MAG: hypothetical protein K2N94_14790, partial [Lachnospiraceae bacterium]|nr:hypothetical protein [Lachnospiraceae bacterium]